MSYYIMIKKPNTEKYYIQTIETPFMSNSQLPAYLYTTIGTSSNEIIATMKKCGLPVSQSANPGEFFRRQTFDQYASGFDVFYFDGAYWTITTFRNWKIVESKRIFIIKDEDIEEYLEMSGYENIYPVDTIQVGDLILTQRPGYNTGRTIDEVVKILNIWYIDDTNEIDKYELQAYELLNRHGVVRFSVADKPTHELRTINARLSKFEENNIGLRFKEYHKLYRRVTT